MMLSGNPYIRLVGDQKSEALPVLRFFFSFLISHHTNIRVAGQHRRHCRCKAACSLGVFDRHVDIAAGQSSGVHRARR